MAERNFHQSKLSIQLSILIGRYLPKKMGYRFGENLARFLTSRKNLNITRAIFLNQFIVNDKKFDHDMLTQRCIEVLSHAGKCFVDLYKVYDNPDLLDDLVPLTTPMKEFIDLSLDDQGYMVVAPHLSNFDLVVASLVKHGFKGKVLSYPNPGSGYQLQNQIRESLGMELVPLGDPSLEPEILAHLMNGGITATGVDRPVPDRKKRHYVNFFNHPSPLPVGYIRTALTANVPIIVVTGIMEPDGTYGFRHSGPIKLKRYNNKMEDIRRNTEEILKKVEEYIRLAPEQWQMYYPVWPDLINEVP